MKKPILPTIIPGWLWPGIIVTTIIVFLIFTAFFTLWYYIPTQSLHLLLMNSYLWYVISFTFIQAFFSTFLSTIPAIVLARALYRRRFPGRTLLLRFFSITLVMPVLVSIFGIISVFGRKGWLAQLCQMLQIEYCFSPYGFNGVILGHVFFNLPLATRLLLQALESIPVEYRKLVSQLGMTTGSFFRLVEWPYLRRQLLPSATLIFMLCFSSFVTVLVLGGGPRFTTIELAIYQALIYDFDIGCATLLALIQMLCCFGIIILSYKLLGNLPIGYSYHFFLCDYQIVPKGKIGDALIILFAIFLLLPPLLAIFIDGVNSNLPIVLRKTSLWRAIFTSLSIAMSAGLLCLLFTIMLLWSSRELHLRKRWLNAKLLDLIGMVILSIPSIVLSTSFFILSINNSRLPTSPALVVILTNSLMAIPYALKILESPMQDVCCRYKQLCLSLNIIGLNRLRLVEWRILRQPAGRALAFSSILSIGDFDVIAIFGSEDFKTLPLYLYQQIGAYHNQDGAVTALVLLLLCLFLFTFFERCLKSNDNT